MQNILAQNLERKRPFGRSRCRRKQDVTMRNILLQNPERKTRFFWRKQDVTLWVIFIRIRSRGRILWIRQWTFRLEKLCRTSLLVSDHQRSTLLSEVYFLVKDEIRTFVLVTLCLINNTELNILISVFTLRKQWTGNWLPAHPLESVTDLWYQIPFYLLTHLSGRFASLQTKYNGQNKLHPFF
jgi:hypothetical protein